MDLSEDPSACLHEGAGRPIMVSG
eukprot:SAG22_NODE_12384_length_444_cov_3.568116_1_plen_23_part_10